MGSILKYDNNEISKLYVTVSEIYFKSSKIAKGEIFFEIM